MMLYVIAATIELFHRQPQAYLNAATNVRLRLTVKRNTVQKVAGTLRVPSADPHKALLLKGHGTWNVPTTLLY